MTSSPDRARLAVLASGRGTNLDHLAAVGYPIVGVATNRPSSGAAGIAKSRGLPLGEFPQSRYESGAARDAAMLAWLVAREPQVVVLAGYDRIMAPALVQAFAGRILNLHPSLLPAFAGGMDAVAQALRAGVKVTGCTVHLVTEDVDGGPILRQEAVEVRPGDTEETLHERIHAAERRILPLAIDDVFPPRVRGREVS
jgi:phosphoribosylglycinamide formyltransferase-1